MTASRRVFASVLLACLLVGESADAQTAASAAAEKLFREGKALSAAQRYEEAIEKFRASEELEPSVGALLSLGDAYRAIGKVASAWSAYVAARDLAKARNDSRVTDANQRVDDVSSRLPRLTVRVSGPDVAVTDNDLSLPPASFGSSLPVDPGTHTIVATAKGKRPYRATQEIAEGQRLEVVVPALEPEETRVEAPPPDDRGDSQRVVGTGLLIGGAALTVAGVVFGGLAISRWGTVTDTCPNKLCRNDADRRAVEGDISSAETFAAISTTGTVVGLVAVGIGVVLKLTAPSKVTVTPAVGGLGVTFH